MSEQRYIVTGDDCIEFERIVSYPEYVQLRKCDIEWLEAHEYKEPKCEDIASEYGKFVCSVCGCVVHDTSVIDNGGLYHCPDCGAAVVDL